MSRASTWAVVERCLALLVRLTRGPATTQDLLDIVKSFGDGMENASRQSLLDRFEDDRDKLHRIFGCILQYNRADGTYRLVSMDQPLIDLPSDAMRGLAFLQTTFGEDTAPMSREVHALANVLLMLISETGREEVERVRGLIEVDLRQRDEDKIPDEIWNVIQKACSRCQELEFEYLSPRHEEPVPRTHHVEPIRCSFDSVRAHYYLEAYCVEHRGPHGAFPGNEIWHYRMGRILRPQLLSRKFVPGTRRPRTHELVYELTPRVARLGVTKHIPNSQVEKRPDGSAIVRAVSTDLFFDMQTLLHYGENCRVLGGAEALREVKRRIKEMYEQYLGT